MPPEYNAPGSHIPGSKFLDPCVSVETRKKFPSFMVYLMMLRYAVHYMSGYGHGRFEKRKKSGASSGGKVFHRYVQQEVLKYTCF